MAIRWARKPRGFAKAVGRGGKERRLGSRMEDGEATRVNPVQLVGESEDTDEDIKEDVNEDVDADDEDGKKELPEEQ